MEHPINQGVSAFYGENFAMSSPEQMQQDAKTVLQYMSGFIASKALFSAVSIDLFAHLGNNALTVAELAELTDTQERSLEVLLNALTALDLLHQSDDTYRNSSATRMLLSGATPADMRATVTLFNKMLFNNLAHFDEFLVTGESPVGNIFTDSMPAEQQAVMSQGFAQLSAGTALALAQTYDFSQHKKLLDVGGGTGSFLKPILQKTPDLHVAIFDKPQVIDIAKNEWARSDADIAFYSGMLFSDDLPDGYDVILSANLAHNLSPEQNKMLLTQFRNGVEKGATLLYISTWTNPEHTEPLFAALMSMVFNLHTTGAGQAYSVNDAQSWLNQTGWKLVNHRPLGGISGLIIAEAV